MMLLIIFSLFIALAFASSSPIHYTISRRGGNFPALDVANLTYLLEELKTVESRYGATSRCFKENTVARKPKELREVQGSTVLLGDVGREGNWFADLQIGDPAQQIQMDLDMLTADWWIFSTGGKRDSMLWDFNSKTYVDSEIPLGFPNCHSPTDVIHLPMTRQAVQIQFAHCKPSPQWIRTLPPSGAYLGLAPSQSLSQTKSKSLMPQLLEKDVINSTIWSILLANGKDGIFTIGGTAPTVRQVEKEMINALEKLPLHGEIKRSDSSVPGEERKGEVEDWKWARASGAGGWWQILMSGIWTDGKKILENQPIILDVNTPFIVAPPIAARTFYASVSGSRQLEPPYDQFYAHPCFNPPEMQFEFAQWNVDIMKGKRGDGRWSPGGAFSLGRIYLGSGYCIGMVVESRWGMKTNHVTRKLGFRKESSNGLENAWIMGEPFFRDVQVAFDWKEKRVGMQKI